MTRSSDGHQESEALQEFLHSVTHDMNEPIRQIISFGEILQEEEYERLSADGQLYLRSIIKAGDRMQGMLSGLLQLARISSRGKAFTNCDLNLLLEQELAYFEVEIEYTNASIDIQALPRVRGDAAQLRTLIRQLLRNALKYSRPSQSPVITIKPAALVDPVRAGVSITDNGIGFEPKYAEIIFKAFQRLHPPEDYPGAGIGLSLCRRICERHGGQISARATVDQGAEFTFELGTATLDDNCTP